MPTTTFYPPLANAPLYQNILDFLIRMPYGEVGVHYVTYQGRRILVLGYNPIYVTLG